MSDRAKAGMGGGKGKKSSHRPHEIRIKRGDTGGFVVTHHHKNPVEPTTHSVADTEQLQQHVQDNMGDQPPSGSPMQPQAAMPMPPQGM